VGKQSKARVEVLILQMLLVVETQKYSPSLNNASADSSCESIHPILCFSNGNKIICIITKQTISCGKPDESMIINCKYPAHNKDHHGLQNTGGQTQHFPGLS
jgi:hypothetical protein